MNDIYSLATTVANNAQSKLDGGIYSFFLENFLALSNSSEPDSDYAIATFSSHFGSTICSGGYGAGIFFGVLWSVALIFGISFLCWMRYRKRIVRSINTTSKQTNSLVHDVSVVAHSIFVKKICKNSNVSDNNVKNSCNGHVLNSNRKSSFFLTRRRIQSHWMCLACQFILVTVLISLLFLLMILGLVTNQTLHMNLVTEPNINISLIKPFTNRYETNNHKVFPEILQALETISSYFSDFVNATKTATQPAVEKLIIATELMQNETTIQFNKQIFDKMGIDQAFELGDKLGVHTVRLMQLALPLKKHVHEYADSISNLNMAIARWTGYMEQVNSEHLLCLNGSQCLIPSQIPSDLSVRSDWRLTRFDFAIALNFVTDVQNRTPESIQTELTRGRDLASLKMAKTMERMRIELNIPGTIRNLTNTQWDNLAENFLDAIKTVKQSVEYIITRVFPTTVVASNYFLCISCVIWFGVLCITFGIAWLLCQYHCVPKSIPVPHRERIRCAGSCGLIFLLFLVFMSCLIFLIAGYAHTEICRYINPNHPASFDMYTYTLQTNHHPTFALDVHVNTFLDKNWVNLENQFKVLQMTSGQEILPLPRFRSPVKALTVGCRENLGLLDALSAVDTFDYKSLNKPKLTNRFINIGRDIMKASLYDLEVNEMFPPKVTESIQMASRLDDFLIPFDDVRLSLPRKFLNVTFGINETEKSNLISKKELVPIWNRYKSYLNKSNISKDVINRADELTQKVLQVSNKITGLLDSIDLSLLELSKLKPIGPTVVALQKKLDSLVAQLSNRPQMLDMAMKMYDEHIASKMPAKVEELMHRIGPTLVKEVGRCRKLYDAYTLAYSGFCDRVVAPLSGLWLIYGLCTLLATLALALSLCLLLHKLPHFPLLEIEKPNTFEKIASVEVENVENLPNTLMHSSLRSASGLHTIRSCNNKGKLDPELEPLHKTLIRNSSSI